MWYGMAEASEPNEKPESDDPAEKRGADEEETP
jgi:hypothetical protein